MQKQIRLFLNAAEMLVFNTLFERNKPTISLTRLDFEKLLNDIKEAKFEGDLNKFVDKFIEEMINSGLLVRVEPASEQSPIGVLRPLIAKDEIAGPQYNVERGVFQIAVPLKSKPAPVQSAALEVVRSAKAVQTFGNQTFDERFDAVERCFMEQQKDIEEIRDLLKQCLQASEIKASSARAVLKSPIQQIIDSPKFTEFKRIDRTLIVLILSPFAKSWFLQEEVREFLMNNRRYEKFYSNVLALAITQYKHLFEYREISKEEKQAKSLRANSRYYLRLSAEGTARAVRCLKKYAAAAGVNYEHLIKNADANAEEPIAALKAAPEVEQSAPVTVSEAPAALDMTAFGKIVKSEIFDRMSRGNKVLLLVRVSPLAYRWFMSRELKAFFRTLPDVSNEQQAMMTQAVEESMSPLARQGYFQKRKLTEPDWEGKKIFSTCQNEYRLTREGRARAAEWLKLFRLSPTPSLFPACPFDKTQGSAGQASSARGSQALLRGREIESQLTERKPASSPVTVSTATKENEGLVDFNRIVKAGGNSKMPAIDLLVVFAGLSPWSDAWFGVEEFFAFIEQRIELGSLSLLRVEKVLLAHSRRRRDPFDRNDFIPKENKDLKYRMTRFGMKRFFELIKFLNAN